MMFTPGAVISGFNRPPIEGPRDVKSAIAPERTKRSTVRLNVPPALSAVPAANVMPTEGIVTLGSEPPIGAGVPSSLLFAIITNSAPLACAANTLTVNAHAPRSMITPLPVKSTSSANASHAVWFASG